MSIGQIIWEQLSIGTKMACGMRYPYLLDDGLEVTVGRGNKLQIRLNGMDYYDIQHISNRGNRKVLESQEDVDCEQLSEVCYHMVNK